MPITSGMFPVASRYITSGSCGPIAAAAAAAAAATSSSYFVASCTSCPSTALFFLSGYVSHAAPFSPSTLHPSSRQPAENAFRSHFCSDHMCVQSVSWQMISFQLIRKRRYEYQRRWRFRTDVAWGISAMARDLDQCVDADRSLTLVTQLLVDRNVQHLPATHTHATPARRIEFNFWNFSHNQPGVNGDRC